MLIIQCVVTTQALYRTLSLDFLEIFLLDFLSFFRHLERLLGEGVVRTGAVPPGIKRPESEAELSTV